MMSFVRFLEDPKQIYNEEIQSNNLKPVDERDDIFEQSKYLYGHINFFEFFIGYITTDDFKYVDKSSNIISPGSYRINLYIISEYGRDFVLEFKKKEPRDKYYKTDVNGFDSANFNTRYMIHKDPPHGLNERMYYIISNRKITKLSDKLKKENFIFIANRIYLIKYNDEIIGFIIEYERNSCGNIHAGYIHYLSGCYNDFIFHTNYFNLRMKKFYYRNEYIFRDYYNPIKTQKYTIVKKSNIVEHINKFKKLFIEKYYSPDNFVNTEM